jgi:hypothetical protein
MKKVTVILLSLSLTIPVFGQPRKEGTLASVESLMWLEGIWDRINAKAGQEGHERWEKSASSSQGLQGFGVTKSGADTVFLEKLWIQSVHDSLFYIADVPGNQKPVYFFIHETGASYFVCENADHDFPKKIVYRRRENELHVTISGDGKSIDFQFHKR